MNDRERVSLHYQRVRLKDIPDTYDFDKYGLIVRGEFVSKDEDANVRPSVEGGVIMPMRKRQRSVESNQPGSKRARTAVRRERSDEEQMEDLASVLRSLDEDFAEKVRLSQEQEWCAPVPHARKVCTVQEFYKAFHDTRTLPIYTCMICYRKCAKAELEDIDWHRWARGSVEKRDDLPFACRRCFPPGEKIPGCPDCVRHLGRGALCPAAQLHLKSLTPVEEKLIALNSCYGFITKYSLVDGHRQSVRYPKHIKGHITVFPNNVQELVTNVLPHPLLKVIDEIHVSWHGAEKPAPSDLSTLLSVRRCVVERALVWLKRHNPLYANVHIDRAEMDGWDASPYGRNEPSAWERARTGQVVPPMERGLDDEGPVDIRDVLATLSQGHDIAGDVGEVDAPDHVAGENKAEEADVDSAARPIHEISSSGMFALDAGPDVTDVEKLRSVCNALGQPTLWGPMQGIASAGSAEVWRGNSEDFADSFDTRFFAKTFPTLFPRGNGGPRNLDVSVEAESAAQNLVSSRSMSLETWAQLVLQRHGGRFGTHHIFAFLAFNMGVRSRNRRVSIVERIVRSLSLERLEVARVELELLRSLSLYRFRQPMSRESRLSMRRKIKSLIIQYGRELGEAEAFLISLNLAYKRTRLAISDPISIFFKAVETNKRGNIELSSILRDVEGKDQTEYQERVIRYVDSVFTEVCLFHNECHRTSIKRHFQPFTQRGQ
ncbi:hypothetical protein K469DRAFT_710096 [Zopfia rhizophila CBS 207.26]|uniref:Uncharacterized protein n=1 Tax=Zopfia rhizophila CBS 207.26 TaxID=1314779 RepID=A0A6A6E225_9PEZI|nr:hypothetical protein K469DRAFT_710096 [Zopfia rhizophila CBS 207.26]